MNPSRLRAACTGSHKYLPLKEAALSFETTTSWAIKKKEKKRKKPETTTQKNTTGHLTPTPRAEWDPAPSCTPTCGRGEAAQSLSSFPVSFLAIHLISPFFAHFSACTWCFHTRAAMQHPCKGDGPDYEQPNTGRQRGITAVSRGVTVLGASNSRVNFKGWG